MKTHLFWKLKQTPPALRPMLRELGKFYPIRQGPPGDMALTFENVKEGEPCEITISGTSAKIRYSTQAYAARAVGAILSGLVAEGRSYSETTPFESLGVMLDCSRNAVMKVDHLKKWLRQLALLGYNRVMLYTEDTYEIPGEPYFGYQRGAYSAFELKAIDEYASTLGRRCQRRFLELLERFFVPVFKDSICNASHGVRPFFASDGIDLQRRILGKKTCAKKAGFKQTNSG